MVRDAMECVRYLEMDAESEARKTSAMHSQSRGILLEMCPILEADAVLLKCVPFRRLLSKYR